MCYYMDLNIHNFLYSLKNSGYNIWLYKVTRIFKFRIFLLISIDIR